MTTKLFLDLEDVKDRMAINPELEGVDDNLESAIVAAQLHLETRLDSLLEKRSWVSVFQLDPDSYSGMQPSGLYRLYLKSGFVLNTPAVTVEYGSVWNDPAFQPVPPTDYYLDPEKGLVYLDTKYNEAFIRVSYTTGFDKASQLPGWTREALLSFVPLIINFSQVTNRNAEAAGLYKSLAAHAQSVYAPYYRNVGFCFRPIF